MDKTPGGGRPHVKEKDRSSASKANRAPVDGTLPTAASSALQYQTSWWSLQSDWKDVQTHHHFYCICQGSREELLKLPKRLCLLQKEREGIFDFQHIKGLFSSRGARP